MASQQSNLRLQVGGTVGAADWGPLTTVSCSRPPLPRLHNSLLSAYSYFVPSYGGDRWRDMFFSSYVYQREFLGQKYVTLCDKP